MTTGSTEEESTRQTWDRPNEGYAYSESSTALRFGRLAVRQGLLSEEQLGTALKEQSERKVGGRRTRLGQILLEKGFLGKEEVLALFILQGKLGGHTQVRGYSLMELIGRGAMGKIYKARHVALDRIVALKILAPKLAGNSKYVKRFLREARLAGKLRHENIVFVLDAGISNGVHYYAMEYIKGKTLKEIITTRGARGEEKLLRLALHLARALEHADNNGVLHRDIKPSNIIVSEEGVPKICDFGLAKDILFSADATTNGVVLGTPLYISPEQIMGRANDIRCDIYSLGATLYHCACGSAPFEATGTGLLVKHLREDPAPLNARIIISVAAAGIIHKMLRKKPDKRFQTPGEICRALEMLLFPRPASEEGSEEARKQSKVKPPRRRRRKK